MVRNQTPPGARCPYYTPEQLAQLEARREEVGEDQIEAIEGERAELSAQMKTHRDAGVDPSDHCIRALLS